MLADPRAFMQVDQPAANSCSGLVPPSDAPGRASLTWEDLAEREKLWSAFVADAEWTKVAAETEKDGPLVQNIANQLLRPAAFSAMK